MLWECCAFVIRESQSAAVVLSQGSASSGSLEKDGFKSSSEYSRSQLEASAAQKESFFTRKMQVEHLPVATAAGQLSLCD